MKKTLFLLCLVAVAVLTACSPSKPQEPQVDRVALLDNKVNSLMAEIDSLKRTVSENSEAMDELRDSILQQLQEISAESAKISVKFDTIESRLSALSERMDDNEFRMSNMRKEVNSLRISRTGTEYTRPTGTSDRYESETPYDSSTEAGGAGQQGADTIPSNERDAYQMAYNDFLRGEYAMAIEGFRNYLASYPQGNNRENARYYLAEALFNQGDFEGAVEEYDTFILNYPNSPLMVNAKYKKALSFLESNQTPSGVILLRQIINQYPESNESRLASEKLRSLGLNP